MTNIQRELKDRIEKYSNPDKALERFNEQKKHIQEIAQFEGMKEIRVFWLSQEQQALEELTKISPENPYKIAETQAQYKLAKKFNDFIAVRTK